MCLLFGAALAIHSLPLPLLSFLFAILFVPIIILIHIIVSIAIQIN